MSSLTEQQFSILESSVLGAGPVAVKAGPGSGKTHTVVSLIKQHLEIGVSPTEVIAITFTRRAATELKERLGNAGKRVRASTIDALALDIVSSKEANTAVLSPQWSWNVFSVCCDMAGAKPTSTLYDTMCKLQEREYTGQSIDGDISKAERVLSLYESICEAGSYRDYSMMIGKAIQIVESGSYRSVCRLLVVDEAQDTSLLQWRLIKALAKQSTVQLVIVGDLNQNIYSWRNAAPEVFEGYLQSEDCIALPLNQSFRCSPQIVRASNLLIELNPGATGGVVSKRVGAFEPVISCPERPVLAVAGLLDQLYLPDDIAVLCRTNRTVQHVARELLEIGVQANAVTPIEGSLSFLVAATLFGVNQHNTVHQILLRSAASEVGISLRGSDAESLIASLASAPGGYKLVSFVSKCACDDLVFGEVLNDIREVPEYRRAVQDLSKSYGGYFMEDAVGQLLRVPEVEQLSGAITVSTIHQAKGLEWPAVVIADLKEGVFPSKKSLKSEAGIIEERRLMYVAMTRAKDSLTLCYDALAPSQFVFPKEVYRAGENEGLAQETIREAGW
jgi:superfamily I DNA/RNA helicase